MRPRPIRSNLYLPITVLKVSIGDWRWVLLITMVGYFVPFFLHLKIWIIPAWLFTGIGSLIGSIIFFSYIRTGRRPNWFEHNLRFLMQKSRIRRALPADSIRSPRKSWTGGF